MNTPRRQIFLFLFGWIPAFLALQATGICAPAGAQLLDTVPGSSNDSFFLLRSKGLLGKLAQAIVADTSGPDQLQRLDILYSPYAGRVVRRIDIRRVDFGIPINDTARSFKNTLTHLADALHKTTSESVVRKHLFFREGDRLKPILLADNERHLRDQAFLNDARFIVRPVLGTRDSVDVVVLTKDVLSIGGSFRMSSLTRVEAAVREENLAGMGDRFEMNGFYDEERSRSLGYGTSYLARNIGGSFADVQVGFRDFTPSFNTFHRQETELYLRLVRPLVNPYMPWIYAFEASWHDNRNLYFPDSVHQRDNRYSYYDLDGWVGYNMNIHTREGARDDRIRTLLGLRIFQRRFDEIPSKYETDYFYQYANLTGILASISVFRQDFYKTSYVYGFGRHEDVPEGFDLSFTTGWTDKERRVRPYTGLDLQYRYFARNKNYFHYTLRLGGYHYQGRYEDISVLANLEFFSRLRSLGRNWTQRSFLMAGISTQLNKELNEPLLVESQYGLPEYENIFLGGDHRLTVKAESVFFNPWSLASFRFAPFVFGNGMLLTPEHASLRDTKLYGTVGAGLRSRNESLIFGTLEFRTYYFPGRNFNGDAFRFEFNTNVRFKYNAQQLRRPEFIQVN